MKIDVVKPDFIPANIGIKLFESDGRYAVIVQTDYSVYQLYVVEYTDAPFCLNRNSDRKFRTIDAAEADAIQSGWNVCPVGTVLKLTF